MIPGLDIAARVSLDVASAHFAAAARMALAAGVPAQAVLDETWQLVAEVVVGVDATGVRVPAFPSQAPPP